MTAKTTAPANGAPGRIADEPASAAAAGSTAALTAGALVAALPNPTVVFAADGPRFTVLAANDAALAATHRSRDAVVGRPLAEAFPNESPDDPAASGLADLRTSLEVAVRTGRAQPMLRQRYDLQRPDGVWEARYWDAVNIPIREPNGVTPYVLHQTEEVTAQVRSEEAAVQSELRAARILERVADAHCVLDRDFRIRAVNAAAERVLGVPRVALLGRSHWEVFPTSVDSPIGRAYRRVVAEGVEEHVEHHHTGEGYDLHLEVDAYPTDEGGVAVFWRDVTERKHAEGARERTTLLLQAQAATLAMQADELQATAARLQEQVIVAEQTRLAAAAGDSRYRALLASLDTGFCVMELLFDADGIAGDCRFLEANRTFFQQSGLPADIVGRQISDVSSAWEQHWWERLGGVAHTGESARFANYSAPLNRWFDVFAYRVDDPTLRRVAALFTDITGAKTTEAEREQLLSALDAERERLRTLVLQMPAPLAVLEGPDHRFSTVNDAFRALTGPRPELVGRTAREAFPELEGQGQQLFERLDRVYTTGESWADPESLVHYDRDGSGVLQETWLNIRLEPICAATGEVTAILNFAVDVTAQVVARRETERLLAATEDARSAAESANLAKTQFLANMSHELRTPLNAIDGYAELMELGIRGPVSAEQQQDLARIRKSQRHLLGLINGVLNYARVEAGVVHYEWDDVPVDEVLAMCEALTAPQLRNKGLVLHGAQCDASFVVRADREKLQQVVLNLLSNAIKFTNPGGVITLQCEPADGDDAGTLLIRLSDTGIGIDAGQLARVFDPFVQIDTALTRTRDGTGLGLAINRDLARGMGGDLSVDSELGTGSTFTVSLRRAKSA